jgi:hypothetical protein
MITEDNNEEEYGNMSMMDRTKIKKSGKAVKKEKTKKEKLAAS